MYSLSIFTEQITVEFSSLRQSVVIFLQFLWITVSHKAVGKVLAGTTVSSDGSSGEESNSQLTHRVVGRSPCWLLAGGSSSVPCHVGLSIG